jgi:hypothetical protein
LDLSRVDPVDEELADAVDGAIRELDRRHIPVVLVARWSCRRAAWLAAGAAMVLADVDEARDGAAGLVDMRDAP